MAVMLFNCLFNSFLFLLSPKYKCWRAMQVVWKLISYNYILKKVWEKRRKKLGSSAWLGNIIIFLSLSFSMKLFVMSFSFVLHSLSNEDSKKLLLHSFVQSEEPEGFVERWIFSWCYNKNLLIRANKKLPYFYERKNFPGSTIEIGIFIAIKMWW
jgi:hypothetical protein